MRWMKLLAGQGSIKLNSEIYRINIFHFIVAVLNELDSHVSQKQCPFCHVDIFAVKYILTIQ